MTFGMEVGWVGERRRLRPRWGSSSAVVVAEAVGVLVGVDVEVEVERMGVEEGG